MLRVQRRNRVSRKLPFLFFSFGYLCFQNTTNNKTLETTVSLTSQGIKLRKPDRGQQVVVTVGPGLTKLVLSEINYRGFSLKSTESIRIY